MAKPKPIYSDYVRYNPDEEKKKVGLTETKPTNFDRAMLLLASIIIFISGTYALIPALSETNYRLLMLASIIIGTMLIFALFKSMSNPKLSGILSVIAMTLTLIYAPLFIVIFEGHFDRSGHIIKLFAPLFLIQISLSIIGSVKMFSLANLKKNTKKDA